MNTISAILAGSGILGIALAAAIWQLVRKAKKAERLEYENTQLKDSLEKQKKTTDIFTRPRGSKSDIIDRL